MFSSYGFLIAMGLLLSGGIALFLCECGEVNRYDFILFSCYTALCGALGAKILYLAVSAKSIEWNRFFEAAYFKAIMGGGFVFYGAIPSGMIGMQLARKIHKLSIEPILRVFTVCFPLAHAFGRVGCALVGCCYGVPFESPVSIIYHRSPIAPHGIALFPVQLAEAGVLCLLFVWLLRCFFRGKSCRFLCVCYLLNYCMARFWLEYLRGDAVRGHLGRFSTAQWISMILFFGVMLSVVNDALRLMQKKSKKE